MTFELKWIHILFLLLYGFLLKPHFWDSLWWRCTDKHTHAGHFLSFCFGYKTHSGSYV